MQSDKTGKRNNIVKENFKAFFGESAMARFMELAKFLRKLRKITSHKEIVGKIANFF